MIVFKRLGGELIALNPDLIERVEATPDTVVTMVDDKKFLVAESLEEVLELITDYRAYVIARANDLTLSNQGGRPALHVVPQEHVTSAENVERHRAEADGVDLQFDGRHEPDGRVHLEFGRRRAARAARDDDREPGTGRDDAVRELGALLDQLSQADATDDRPGYDIGGR